MKEHVLDTQGMKCPKPLFEVHRLVKSIAGGDTIQVVSDDPAFPLDIEAWCRRTGHGLRALTRDGARSVALIRKAEGAK